MRTKRRRSRVIAAATAGLAGAVLFVVLGGAGLAQSSITSAHDQYGTPAQDQYGASLLSGKKIVICHKLKSTINVSVNAWPAHRAHGDTEGACAVAANTQATTKKTKKPKGSTEDAAVTSTTTSNKKPKKPKGTTATSTSTSETSKQHKQHKANHGNVGTTSTSAGNSGKPKNPKHANGRGKHAPVAGVEPQTGGPGNGNGHGKGKDK